MNQTVRTDDIIRMKDIISQLTDIIYLLCDAKRTDVNILVKNLTNMSFEELERYHFETDANPSQAKSLQ